MSELFHKYVHAGERQTDPLPWTVHRAHHSSATGRTTSDRLKVLVVNAGMTTIRHQSGALDVVDGQVLLLPPDHWYTGEPAGEVVTTTAYIDTDFLRRQARWIPASSAPALLLSGDQRRSDPVLLDLPSRALSHLHASFRVLLESQQRQAPALMQLSQVAEVLEVLSRPIAHHARGHDVVQQAVWLLLEHLHCPWSIDVLAAAVSISKAQISRLFRQHLRMSPAEFIRTERAHRMAEYLLARSDSIEAIAQQVGWHDPSHAARVFRHIYGVSPQRYRQTHGTAQDDNTC